MTLDSPEPHASVITTIIIPCFNEAQRLNPIKFRRFVDDHSSFRLLFVDDGSTDQTSAVIRRMAQRASGRIDLLQLSNNQGKAEAVRQGILRALEPVAANGGDRSHVPSFVGYFDADLATPLAELPRMIDVGCRKQEIEVILGCRLSLQGRQIDRKFLRRLCGQAFSLPASVVYGKRLHDTQCGAKIFRVHPQLQAVFSEPFLSRWLFDVEILVRLRWLSAHRNHTDSVSNQIFEHPVDAYEDKTGSKLKLVNFLAAPIELVRIAWCYRGHHQSLGSMLAKTQSLSPDSSGTTEKEPIILSVPQPQSQTTQQTTRRAA